MAYFTPEELAYIREAVDASNMSDITSCFKSKHADYINRLRKDNQNLRDQLNKVMFQGEHNSVSTQVLKSDLPEVQVLMTQIKTILDKQNKKGMKGQYRDKTKKTKFNLQSAFLLGATTNALGASKNKEGVSSFGTPHNIPSKKGKGVCLTPVLARVSLPKWKKNLWTLSQQLIEIIDPDFAVGEYVVNYSTMTDPKHYVKKHTDSDDISYQYGMSLGDYEGTFETRIYDKDDKVVGDYDYKNRVLKMDGRLPHEVISKGFKGVRHCVIFFKSFDKRKLVCDPIFETPCFV
jgi:hypothetical protein